ncbi:hypothetical protein MASR2M48_08420 [Spirochaetota bacterium]
MKRTITVLISFALLMTVAVPAALASPARVLTKPTIDRFIKDFPAMQVEFEALGDKTMESIESLVLVLTSHDRILCGVSPQGS